MGEVYRAKDTKLDREVAIKVLPDALAQDPERLARFEREAKVLASLNHPNIAQIYGIEERALVMELVSGETLRGPVPFETALKYAQQIASALEAAHEKGITHRDLKPGNIMVTPAGTIKVLDFGLAAVAHAPASDGDPTNSPTLTMGATQAGAIMGTAAYMSPEQARGKPVDRRADIWAFGVVLYEMLTGKRLFQGETITEVLAAVLKEEPKLDKAPVQARLLLRRCLEKDPKRRLHDIADAIPLLEEAPAPPAEVRFAKLPWAIAGALAIGMAVLLWAPWRAPRTSADRPFVQLDLDAGPDEVSQPVLSPDGSLIVFVSKGQLATRRLDQTRITPLAGTEGASFPFFSPNGQQVAFFADNKLKKIALDGGVPQTICDAAAPRGGSWGEDEYIVAALGTLVGLSRVSSAAGSTPQPLTDPKADPDRMTAHRWPQILPGGKGVIFAATSGLRGSLRVLSPGGQMKNLVPGSTYGRYLPSGHLVYYQSGALFAAPLDLGRLELTGPAVSLAEGVAYTPNVAHADFELSPSGALVYVRGPGAVGRVISWMDSSGALSPLLAKPREYSYPRVSPDGKKLAAVISQNGQDDLWVYDSIRDTLTKLTSGVKVAYAVWTPDGEFIVFGGARMSWTRSDGSAKGESEAKAAIGLLNPWSFSKDTKRLAYYDTAGRGSWVAQVERTPEGMRLGQPEPLLQNASSPAISPDGRFIAYTSDQSGRQQVYVMPFQLSAESGRAKAARSQVSNEGGAYVIWSQTAQELFYSGPDRRIWVTGYTINGDSFVPEKARVWSPKQLADFGNNPTFDMAPDGKRAAVLLEAGGEDPKPETHIRVLLNVGDELRRRSAASGKP
jgi:Tol biopolymer transport system component